MAGLINATTTGQPTAAPTDGEWKQYNGQQVRIGQDYMNGLNETVAKYNKITGGNMTAQEYDKGVNPTSYGARWGIPETEMGKAPTGLLNAAPSTPVAAPTQVATYDPVKATSGTATTTNATAINAGSTGYDATKVNLSPESSAAYQLNKITSADSPLNTAARSFADQQSNRRGLLNSSIAVGASQDAVLRNAMPLAQQDATSHFQANITDANAINRAGEFTAGAKNTAELNNSQVGTQVSQFNAGSANDTSKFNVQQDAQTSQFNASAGNSALAQRANAANQVSLQEVQGRIQKEIARIQADTSLSVADKNNMTSALISQADNETKKVLMTMDAETRTNLANIANTHDALIKSNANASSMYQTVASAIANIQLDKDMQGPAKAAAINTQLEYFRAGLSVMAEVDRLKLGDLFADVEYDASTGSGDGNYGAERWTDVP